MTEQRGLFDLPDPPPIPTRRDRGRRGEHWTRTVAADLHVIDSAALRAAAHQRQSDAVTVDLGPACDPDEDLLDPHEEVMVSDAAAVRWCLEPTTGTWPEMAEALRLDAIELDAIDEGPNRVLASWSATVTITDLDLLRRLAGDPGDMEETFASLWNRAADPYAALNGLPGITWTPLGVEVRRGR